MTTIIHIKPRVPEMIKMARSAPGFKDGSGDATPVFIVKEEPKDGGVTDWRLRVTTFSDYKRVMGKHFGQQGLEKTGKRIDEGLVWTVVFCPISGEMVVTYIDKKDCIINGNPDKLKN